SGHCQTAQAVQRESPAGLPVGLSVCEAYVLLRSMICLEHEITDTPNADASAAKNKNKKQKTRTGDCVADKNKKPITPHRDP
ncbi:hypothetical protein V4C53_32080, partial [Paraburkholderia azotifigens]|uniref:hypothetical protein n=1 Tax=Paraburkholderia azotifigens TaxID=2057004 RepID=UPI0031754E5B